MLPKREREPEPKPNGMPLRNQIRRLRFDRGEMTQQALAEEVGVTRQTIIALEAGKYAPSLLLAFRIARAFGVGVEDVFQSDDGGPAPPGPSTPRSPG